MPSGWQLLTLIALLADFRKPVRTCTSAEGNPSCVAAFHPHCKLSQLKSNKRFPNKQTLTLIASQNEPVRLLGQEALGCHLQLSSAQ